MEAAKISLESTRENVNEVMYKVGYTDNKAFRSRLKELQACRPYNIEVNIGGKCQYNQYKLNESLRCDQISTE